MKKCCVFVLCLLLFAGCSAPSSNVAETEATAAIINENSDFAGHAFLETYTYSGPFTPDYEAKDYNPMDNGPPPFFAYPEGAYSGGDIYGEYLRYPDNKNDFRLKLISIRSAQYHLLGIRVCDTMESANSVLLDYGFADITNEEVGTNGEVLYMFQVENGQLYQLHDIFVFLEISDDSGAIKAIRLSVLDPNRKKENVMY